MELRGVLGVDPPDPPAAIAPASSVFELKDLEFGAEAADPLCQLMTRGRWDPVGFDEGVVAAPVCSKLRTLLHDIADAPVPDPLLTLAGRLEAKLAKDDEDRRRRPRPGRAPL